MWWDVCGCGEKAAGLRPVIFDDSRAGGIAPGRASWHRPRKGVTGRSKPSPDKPHRTQPGQETRLPADRKGQARTIFRRTARDRELLAASTPPPGITTVLTNTMIDTINARGRPRQEQTAVNTTSNPSL